MKWVLRCASQNQRAMVRYAYFTRMVIVGTSNRRVLIQESLVPKCMVDAKAITSRSPSPLLFHSVFGTPEIDKSCLTVQSLK